METQQISNPTQLKELFEDKRREISQIAKEIAQREWELFEFNLFVSASGEEHLKNAIEDTQKLRGELWKRAMEKSNNNKLKALEEYEDLISK